MLKLFIKTFWVFSTIFSLGIFIANAQHTSTDNKPTGKVLITALRIDDSAFSYSGITVLIEGKKLRKEIKLINKANEMSSLVELPIGIYRVTTKKTFDNYRFVRSAFHVRDNTVTKINVFPPFRLLAILTFIDEDGFRDEYNFGEEPKYQVFRVPHNKNRGINFLVRYDQKKQTGNIITFTGDNLMASYDAFSIYANELRINPQTLEIEAFGNIVWENGSKRERFKSAQLFFNEGELKLYSQP